VIRHKTNRTSEPKPRRILAQPRRAQIGSRDRFSAKVPDAKTPARKNRIRETRQHDRCVQGPAAKYFSSVFRKYMIVCARPALMKRGVRVVTNVERGMRWTQRRRTTSGGDADGEIVWS
jgi:hypothetical protein